MIRHDDVSDFHVWQRRAAVEEEQAWASVRGGRFDAACRQVHQSARHTLTGMMRGIWWWVNRYDCEVWRPALEAAFERAGTHRTRHALDHMLDECERVHPARHDAADAGDALSDLARVKVLVDVTWRTFAAALDAAASSEPVAD